MGDRNHRQVRDVLLSVQHELSRHLVKATECGEDALASLDADALKAVGKAIKAVNDWIAESEATVTPEEMGNPDWYAYPEGTELGRLRAIVDAVRPLWDDLTDVDEEGTVKQFPVAHYQAVDEALGALDAEATDG